MQVIYVDFPKMSPQKKITTASVLSKKDALLSDFEAIPDIVGFSWSAVLKPWRNQPAWFCL